ncbi:uncharacterized protein [Saccopteryx bilineata]|uniref:uncharacterized protein n=1 Tax=Saccopteryx bilineata TaxID=59482 RepID=UPI00338E7564
MIQGASEPDGPGWGWDGDGDDDWDNAVLTLLALAVVAATALALHWFGSGQDQEAAGPASTGLQAQPSRAGGAGPVLPPKSKVSGGIERQSSEQGKPDPPGLGQGSPATAGAQDHQPPGSGDLTATAAPALKTSVKVASGGALGQQWGNSTPEVLRGKEKEHLRPGAALLSRSKVGGIPAPLLIHFTPRSPDTEVEMQADTGAVRAKSSAHQAAVHTGEQDTSSWKQGVGPPGSLGRSSGSLRWQVNDSSGARTCRPPRLDPLRLGAVVSVWDAVDAASGLSTAAQRSSNPQESLPPDSVHTGRLTDGSERGFSSIPNHSPCSSGSSSAKPSCMCTSSSSPSCISSSSSSPNPSCSRSPNPSLSPSCSPNPNPSPNRSRSPSPSPSCSPSPSLSPSCSCSCSHSPSPSHSPNPSPSPSCSCSHSPSPSHSPSSSPSHSPYSH